jgi:hypothetical protein
MNKDYIIPLLQVVNDVQTSALKKPAGSKLPAD